MTTLRFSLWLPMLRAPPLHPRHHHQVMTWNDYQESMDISVKHIKQSQLPEWVRALDAPSSQAAAEAAALEVPPEAGAAPKRPAEEGDGGAVKRQRETAVRGDTAGCVCAVDWWHHILPLLVLTHTRFLSGGAGGCAGSCG